MVEHGTENAGVDSSSLSLGTTSPSFVSEIPSFWPYCRHPKRRRPTTTAPNLEEIADYAAQAREFLGKSREYLASGDLHQASEKGWGAASHMVKAVAVAHSWEYERHSDFSQVLNAAYFLTGNDRIRLLRGIPNELHSNYYKRKRHLDAGMIERDLDSVAELWTCWPR